MNADFGISGQSGCKNIFVGEVANPSLNISRNTVEEFPLDGVTGLTAVTSSACTLLSC
jgi:hypothetical protein